MQKAQQTIFSHFVDFGSTTALTSIAGESLTYEELEQLADQLSARIPRHTLVVLICENSVYCAAVYSALISRERPVMLLHHNITPAFLANILEHFQPGHLISPAGYSLPCSGDAVEAAGHYRITAINPQPAPTHPDLALLLTTSGSTGSHKFVRISHKNLLVNTRDIVKGLNIGADQRSITTMPMSYTYGLSIINTHLYSGATLVVDELPIVSKDFFRALSDFEITSFGGVPFTFETLLKLKFWRSLPTSVQYLTQAGGALKKPVFKEMVKQSQEKQVRFYSMYGQTEATARMAILDHAYAAIKTGSIGTPVSSGRFLLLNEQEQAITSPHQQGTLYYLGDNVSMGYASNWQDLQKGDNNRGTINTGDIAYFDEDGFYYIVGREKRFVKIHGHRVSLDEIESILANMGLESAVLGEDDAIRIYTPPQSTTPDILKQLAKTTRIPARIFTLKEQEIIPRLKSGKIDYQSLAQIR